MRRVRSRFTRTSKLAGELLVLRGDAQGVRGSNVWRLWCGRIEE